MSVININTENFENEVLLSDKPVLVDFYADWCGPCRMVSPIVEEIANEDSSKKVCKINVDACPRLAERFDVSSIPTLMVFKDGKLHSSSVGAIGKNNILDMFK